jgi:hypothetical protein
MTAPTERDLARILAYCEAATPGPWERGVEGPSGSQTRFVFKEGEYIAHCHTKFPGIPAAKRNAAFIAQARADLPALVAYVREARAALAGVGELHYAAHGMLTDFDKCQHPICRRAARILEEEP